MRNGAEAEAEETLSSVRLVGLVVCSRAYDGHGRARERGTWAVSVDVRAGASVRLNVQRAATV